MQTRSQDIESLLTDGVFDVPDYQRNYSWEGRQLDDLLDDIRYLPDDQSHFFGNVILEKQEDSYDTASGRRLNAYHIVDGQQRLTTTLMFLSVARQLSARVATLVDESNALHVPKE